MNILWGGEVEDSGELLLTILNSWQQILFIYLFILGILILNFSSFLTADISYFLGMSEIKTGAWGLKCAREFGGGYEGASRAGYGGVHCIGLCPVLNS